MSDGWKKGTIGEVVAQMKNGINCKQNKDGDGEIISRIETISDQNFDFSRVGYSSLSESEKQKYLLGRGDILFSHINSPVHVGKTAILETDQEIYHGVNLMLMRVNEFILPKFFQLFLKKLFLSGYWRSICKQSVNQASVNQKDIKKIPIYYPTLPEQKRIVAILDEAFEGIDAAIANTQQNLNNTRELFDSYLNQTIGKVAQAYPTLSLLDLCDERGITYGVIKLGEHKDDGVPCLRTSNVRRLFIDTNGMKKISSNISNEYHRTILRSGEVLVNVRGTLGGVAVVEHGMVGWNISREVALVPADPKRTNPNYLAYWISAKASQDWLTGVLKGVAYTGINLSDLRNLPVSLPSMQTQISIVENLNDTFARCRELEANYQQKLDSLNELKQSLLAKAFSGELTSQPEQILKEAVG